MKKNDICPNCGKQNPYKSWTKYVELGYGAIIILMSISALIMCIKLIFVGEFHLAHSDPGYMNNVDNALAFLCFAATLAGGTVAYILFKNLRIIKCKKCGVKKES